MSDSNSPNHRAFGRREFVLYACTVFAWSASWYALKVNMSTGIAAPVSTTWRFAIAAILMFVWARFSGSPLWFPWKRQVQFAALGVLLFSTNFILFYIASQYVVSGLLAVVFSLASVINLGIAALRGESSPAIRWLGAVLGVSGIVLLYLPELDNGDTALTGLVLCIGGTLCFCLGNMLSQTLQKEQVSVLSASAWGMSWGAVWSACLATAFACEFEFDVSIEYIASLFFLVTVATLLAFWAFLNLIGRIGPGRAAYATVMFPIGALLLSTLIENWQWTSEALLGVMLALLGNVLVLRGGARSRP